MNAAFLWIWQQIVIHHEIILAGVGFGILTAGVTMPKDWSEGFRVTAWGWFYAWVQEMIAQRGTKILGQANLQLSQAGVGPVKLTGVQPPSTMQTPAQPAPTTFPVKE